MSTALTIPEKKPIHQMKGQGEVPFPTVDCVTLYLITMVAKVVHFFVQCLPQHLQLWVLRGRSNHLLRLFGIIAPDNLDELFLYLGAVLPFQCRLR